MNTVIQSLPVLILHPHARCNCRCVMCDIWKTTGAAELTSTELERHLADIERLSVRWVVFSGGEPLMHSDLFRLCHLLRARSIRVTVLSTGLLLGRNADQIVSCVDDVIVSLDGPPHIHDCIRRVPGAFAQLKAGVERIHETNPFFRISARCTVQSMNYYSLRQTAAAAKSLGLDSISFLATDLTSEAFNRPQPWDTARQNRVALSSEQIEILSNEVDAMSDEWEGTGFVLESRAKLQRIVRHFRAHLGLCEPEAPPCNAPWVSAVVETDGTVRPCFFHKSIGSLNGNSLYGILNGFEAQQFRRSLNVSTNPVCRRCVCSLNWARVPLSTDRIQ